MNPSAVRCTHHDIDINRSVAKNFASTNEMLEVGSLLATYPSSQQQDVTEKESEGRQQHTDGK